MKKVIKTIKGGAGKSVQKYSKLSKHQQIKEKKRLLNKKQIYEKRKTKFNATPKKPQSRLKQMWSRLTGKTKKQENATKKLDKVTTVLKDIETYTNSIAKIQKEAETEKTTQQTEVHIKGIQNQLAEIKSRNTPSIKSLPNTTSSTLPPSHKTSYTEINKMIPTKSKLRTYFSNRSKEVKRTKRNVAHAWQGVKNKFGKLGRSIKKKTPKISLPTFIKTRKTKSQKTLKKTFVYNHNKAKELIDKHDTFSTQIKKLVDTYPYDKKSPDYLAKKSKVELLESKQKDLEGQLRYTTKDIPKLNTNFIKPNGKFNIEALKINITGKKEIYEFNQKRNKELKLQNIIIQRNKIEKLKISSNPINKKVLKKEQKYLQNLVNQRTKIEKSNTIMKLNARSKMNIPKVFRKKLGTIGDKLGASLSFNSSLIRKKTLSKPEKNAVLKKYTSNQKLKKAKKIEEYVVKMFKNKNISIDINNYEFKKTHLNALQSYPDKQIFKQFLNLQEHKKRLNNIMHGSTTLPQKNLSIDTNFSSSIV